MHFHFDGVNEAFSSLVNGVATGEIPTVCSPSRVGDVLQIVEPVLVTYRKPWQRVLLNASRDANPFFHLYESLWMLAGRNDVAPLKYYASDIGKIASDDGVTFNGAYGYRWRCAKGPSLREQRVRSLDVHPIVDRTDPTEVDQLTALIDHLKANPQSRRAVLQMWNVEDDLLKIDVTKDVCCLAWDTKFRSPEGEVNIQELAYRFQTRANYKFPVYSVDTTTGDQRLSWMTMAWKTGTKRTIKFTFEDGSVVRMTGDHIVFRKKKLFDGQRCVGISVEECKACDLKEGDRLLAEMSKEAVSRTSPSGYRYFKRNIYKNTGGRNVVLEHREYMSLLGDLYEYKDGYSIHHKDGNKLNNRKSNLVQLRNSDHFKIDKEGASNPHCKMSNEDRAARGAIHSAVMQGRKTAEGIPERIKSILKIRKPARTNEQTVELMDWVSSISNHKIVKIEEGGNTAVFDFTVPGRHNAVLDNGIVVHNCNLSVMFSIRKEARYDSQGVIVPAEIGVDRYLDMTVTNRSNDMIWGMLGANVVHFSFLQEYMASCLGVEVGVYNQFTNNLHVYTKTNGGFKPDEWLAWYNEEGNMAPDWYPASGESCKFTSSGQTQEEWDDEIKRFVIMNASEIENGNGVEWHSTFLNRVAQPMCHAFHMHKLRDYDAAIYWCEEIMSADWKIAATNWILKRNRMWREKQSAT